MFSRDSFGSYRADKQTNKHTDTLTNKQTQLKTSTALRRWVITGSFAIFITISWWLGLVVARWSQSTKFLYVVPG